MEQNANSPWKHKLSEFLKTVAERIKCHNICSQQSELTEEVVIIWKNSLCIIGIEVVVNLMLTVRCMTSDTLYTFACSNYRCGLHPFSVIVNFKTNLNIRWGLQICVCWKTDNYWITAEMHIKHLITLHKSRIFIVISPVGTWYETLDLLHLFTIPSPCLSERKILFFSDSWQYDLTPSKIPDKLRSSTLSKTPDNYGPPPPKKFLTTTTPTP